MAVTQPVQRTLPPRPAGPPAGPGPEATVRETRAWFDETGVRHTASIKVPVNQYGRPTSTWMRCTRCTPRDRWIPNAVAIKGNPVCDNHPDRQMARLPIPKAPMLPWPALVAGLRPYVWPLVALAAVAAVGAGAASDTNTPAPVWAAAGLLLAWPAARAVRYRLTNRARVRGHLDPDDPDKGRAVQALIGKRARFAGYATTAAGLWVAAASVAGVDVHTAPGWATWTLLAAAWVICAAPWWRYLAANRARTETAEVKPEEVDGLPVDFDQAWTLHVWNNRVAQKRGRVIDDPPPPPVPVADEGVAA